LLFGGVLFDKLWQSQDFVVVLVSYMVVISAYW